MEWGQKVIGGHHAGKGEGEGVIHCYFTMLLHIYNVACYKYIMKTRVYVVERRYYIARPKAPNNVILCKPLAQST